MERDYRKKADELAGEHRTKLAELEARKNEAEADLAARRKDIDEKVASFNTKESKYVRRALLGELKVLLKESETLELSDGTKKKRRIVHRFVWLMLAASGALAAAAAYRAFKTASPGWQLLVPWASASITFFGTLVYYLKWNDRWFREHAETELASKRYKTDVVRASWVAELASEWAAEGRQGLPKELIDAYARNLFSATGKVRESEPAASLWLGSGDAIPGRSRLRARRTRRRSGR